MNYNYRNMGAPCMGDHSYQPSCPAESGCGKSLAMAYVPMQTWCDIYDYDKGFCRGTIFAGLDKPFEGGKCR